MVECIVRYYFKSPKGRVIRFEQTVRFSAVPYQGSQLSLQHDVLTVESILFCEDAAPILIVEDSFVEEEELASTIEEMKSMGWSVASDHRSEATIEA
jgi:hypothetical protein